MELVKKNIHMDRVRTKADDQITVDDDVNISDSMPDAQSIVLDRADVRLDEVKTSTDHVQIKGTLLFSVLYQTEEERSSLCNMDGKVSFEEDIYMEGVRGEDTVGVVWELEDFSSTLINSRKLNVKALLCMSLTVEELYEEETPVGLAEGEQAEVCKKNVEVSELAVSKKDIFRVKEEMPIAQNEPNISKILWQSVQLKHMDFAPDEGKIRVNGEMHIFVLYEGEGEEKPISVFQVSRPVKGEVECSGCRNGMYPDIHYMIANRELEVRTDFDGEERIVGLDLVLDLDIKLYVSEPMELLVDIYGVDREVEATTRVAEYRRMQPIEESTCRLNYREEKPVQGAGQMLHSEGSVQIEKIRMEENSICVEGSATVKTLCRTEGELPKYHATTTEFPWEHRMEAPGVQKTDMIRVQGFLSQLSVTQKEGEGMELKAELVFDTVWFSVLRQEVIAQIQEAPLNSAKVNELPGIVVYIAKEGDTLWQIGKKYYVPISEIKEMNHLTTDHLEGGEKLLLVK